jgi:hypothetical protein
MSEISKCCNGSNIWSGGKGIVGNTGLSGSASLSKHKERHEYANEIERCGTVMNNIYVINILPDRMR